MADQQQPTQGPSFTSTIAKRALAPIVASAATAITAYLMRKAAELWEELLLPKIEEKGGGRAVARDTLESAADKVGGPAAEQLAALAEKVDDEGASTSSDDEGASTSSVTRAKARPKSSTTDKAREEERRRREQRRKKRRQALEQTRSS